MFVVVFIDNLLVYSHNKENHVNHLKVVLQTLGDHQLFRIFSRYYVLLRFVTFVRHIVSHKSIMVDIKKTEAVKN